MSAGFSYFKLSWKDTYFFFFFFQLAWEEEKETERGEFHALSLEVIL